MKNPCVGCGACCAYFRVSFYQGELQSVGGIVPDEDVETISPFFVAMKGTTRSPSRCIRLSGDVGKDASCSIYQCRSSTCRDFKASYENNSELHNIECDKARLSAGLGPLKPCDWTS